MQIIGLFMYLVLQILFVPLMVVGLLAGLYKDVYISKKHGVSFSAVQALQYRWIMHMFDTRKDFNTIAFVKAFPCESRYALWAVMVRLSLPTNYVVLSQYLIKGFCMALRHWTKSQEIGSYSLMKSSKNTWIQ